ncbi:EXS C-terminal [Penicillium taxi]|uniref:EXS C-terminal n=1 Tax=Penicillium taxi TaxID=168475 RepID=UPI0025458484|nr:EXS C-terminal [Penicillium taxi]KAJ5902300.1 EXS C-terminal [Penicillium taxi]
MGPDQHAQLDGFGLIFPFPLRIAAVLVAGFWGWAINLQYLDKANIDVSSLIRYPARTPSQRPLHVSAYRLATLFSIPLVIWLIVFWAVTHHSTELVERLDFIPQSIFIILLLILICPLNRASRAGRIRFLLTLKRVAIGGLAESQDGKFGDVLLADALTSYSRILGDLYVSFCMFFTDGISSTSKPNRACGSDMVVPIIIAIPSAIRLRQCLTEYVRARKIVTRRDPTRGNQHLANAMKYATAFPVIWIASKLRNYNPIETHGFSEVTIMRLLFLFCFINSSYSFYWDIVKDWDFTLLSTEREHKDYPYGLRRTRHFASDRVYHYVIVADFVLRFSWLWRVLPGLAWVSETEKGLFLLMVLEVVRRWMWVFFRVEAEWIRNTHGSSLDDVLLGEYNHKFDAD